MKKKVVKRAIEVKEGKIKEEIKEIKRKLVLSKFTDRRAKFFYEFFFWLGFILIVLTYVTKSEYFLITGIILILISLLVYEIYHKPEKRQKYYFYILYLLIAFTIGYVIYQFLDKVLYVLSLPVEKSWLLYIVIALVILNLLVFVIKKFKTRAEKPKKRERKIAVKKPLFKKIFLRAEKKVKLKKIKKIKKPFFEKILSRKKKRIEPEKKLAKPKIRILKIKAKKAKPIKQMSPKLRKFFKILTSLFLAVILFFGLYGGLTYLAFLIPDKLLFYTLLAMMFFTLLVFAVHLIIAKKAKLSKIQKELKEIKLFGKPKKELKEEEKEEPAQKVSLGKTYKTDIDMLYDLVKKRDHVKISFLAKTFKVDKKTIEDWAQLLEEHGLLKIHYPAIGEAELVVPKEAEKKK